MKTLKSLNGLRVLNTRPLKQGRALSQAIVDAGGVSIDLPALEIVPTSTAWLDTMPDLFTVKQAIFISSNAINYYFSGLKKHDVNWPIRIEVTAVGSASASALMKWGIPVNHIPPHANSESLLQLKVFHHVQDQTILLIKGEDGREDIASTLTTRNANVIPLAVYRRVLPNLDKHHINTLWHDDQVDIILFTSQLSIKHIFALFRADARTWLRSKPCLAISERLAQEALSFGIENVHICSHDTIINSLAAHVFLKRITS